MKTTCEWHIDGKEKCGKPAVYGKYLGVHLCERHRAEFVRRWGEKGHDDWDGKHPKGKEPVL